MAAAVPLEESRRFYYLHLGHKVKTNLIMLRGEVTQVPLDNMISRWQAIFQIAFSFLRNPGWHSGWHICFYTSSLQQNKLYFKLLKKCNASHPGETTWHLHLASSITQVWGLSTSASDLSGDCRQMILLSLCLCFLLHKLISLSAS